MHRMDVNDLRNPDDEDHCVQDGVDFEHLAEEPQEPH